MRVFGFTNHEQFSFQVCKGVHLTTIFYLLFKHGGKLCQLKHGFFDVY